MKVSHFVVRSDFLAVWGCLLPSEFPAKVREEQVVDFVLEKLIALTPTRNLPSHEISQPQLLFQVIFLFVTLSPFFSHVFSIFSLCLDVSEQIRRPKFKIRDQSSKGCS
jgi:hypothetical protein